MLFCHLWQFPHYFSEFDQEHVKESEKDEIGNGSSDTHNEIARSYGFKEGNPTTDNVIDVHVENPDNDLTSITNR